MTYPNSAEYDNSRKSLFSKLGEWGREVGDSISRFVWKTWEILSKPVSWLQSQFKAQVEETISWEQRVYEEINEEEISLLTNPFIEQLERKNINIGRIYFNLLDKEEGFGNFNFPKKDRLIELIEQFNQYPEHNQIEAWNLANKIISIYIRDFDTSFELFEALDWKNTLMWIQEELGNHNEIEKVSDTPTELLWYTPSPKDTIIAYAKENFNFNLATFLRKLDENVSEKKIFEELYTRAHQFYTGAEQLQKKHKLSYSNNFDFPDTDTLQQDDYIDILRRSLNYKRAMMRKVKNKKTS